MSGESSELGTDEVCEVTWDQTQTTTDEEGLDALKPSTNFILLL